MLKVDKIVVVTESQGLFINLWAKLTCSPKIIYSYLLFVPQPLTFFLRHVAMPSNVGELPLPCELRCFAQPPHQQKCDAQLSQPPPVTRINYPAEKPGK